MSHHLQRHPAQLGTFPDPSKDDVGEMRQRISRVASGTEPCHFYQQLGLETWDGRREGENNGGMKFRDRGTNEQHWGLELRLGSMGGEIEGY